MLVVDTYLSISFADCSLTLLLTQMLCVFQYEFVTPLTSLVVVKPNATNAVDAESVDKES